MPGGKVSAVSERTYLTKYVYAEAMCTVPSRFYEEVDEMPSVVQNIKKFFEAEPHGRKVSIEEFKALTEQDKRDFVQMFRDSGIDCDDYTPKAAA